VSEAKPRQAASEAKPRQAAVERKTRETEVSLELCIDGRGEYDVETGIPFFDHMLESFAKHGMFDLRLRAKGDLAVDLHHTVEDVGIALGSAMRQALGSAAGIRRYGQQVLPMAEAKVEVAVDVSNRPYLVYDVELANDRSATSTPPSPRTSCTRSRPTRASTSTSSSVMERARTTWSRRSSRGRRGRSARRSSSTRAAAAFHR
jgi:hypothetical protein